MIEAIEMNSIAYVTTPAGEELAILPRRELEALKEAADHGRLLVDYRAGRVPGLSANETRALVEAQSALSFWRKHRGMTQTALAEKVGVTQNYLSEIESGKKLGDVALWLRLARALELSIEDIVEDD